MGILTPVSEEFSQLIKSDYCIQIMKSCNDSAIATYLPPSFEGYLQVKGNKREGWKRRWAIIKEDVLMCFEMKQDAIKQGWLQKKSSGSGTLSRYYMHICTYLYMYT